MNQTDKEIEHRRPRRRRERHLVVHSVRRNPPDIRKLALVIQALADAQAEKEAEQQHKGPGVDAA